MTNSTQHCCCLFANIILITLSHDVVDRSSFIVISQARNHFDYALHLLGSDGHCARAIESMGLSFQLYPLGPVASQIAGCHDLEGRRDQAETWRSTAASLDAQSESNRKMYAEGLLRLGRVRKVDGDVKAALQLTTLALRYDPTNVFAAFQSGVYLQEMGDIGRAVDMYLVAIELSPNFANGRVNAAAMLQNLNDFPSAIAHYRSYFA
jgi:tetratricopeptide (TPR) repeat protein